MRGAVILADVVSLVSSAHANDPGPGDPARAAPYEGVWWFDAVNAAALPL